MDEEDSRYRHRVICASVQPRCELPTEQSVLTHQAILSNTLGGGGGGRGGVGGGVDADALTSVWMIDVAAASWPCKLATVPERSCCTDCTFCGRKPDSWCEKRVSTCSTVEPTTIWQSGGIADTCMAHSEAPVNTNNQ